MDFSRICTQCPQETSKVMSLISLLCYTKSNNEVDGMTVKIGPFCQSLPAQFFVLLLTVAK